MNTNLGKQGKLLVIVNFSLRAIQLFITIGLVGLIFNRDEIAELSTAIYGQATPLLNSSIFDLMMSNTAAIAITLSGLISVFIKDRFVETIRKKLALNMAFTGIFFSLAVAYVAHIGIGLSIS